MLIDWITARVPLNDLSDDAREACRNFGDRVQRFCPKTGTVRWEQSAWDSIRSDSHQLSMRVGLDLWIQGSPARVMGDGCAVFGSGASAALDLGGCVERMAALAASVLECSLPRAEAWKVSRVDVTGNMRLGSLAEVRDALRVLRDCEGGRYRVSQQAGDTVYWSHRSKHRSGKAYAKGPHLHHVMKQSTYTGRRYTSQELLDAEQLLRLELKLGREFFDRHDWKLLTPVQLREQWEDYFGRMIGDANMTSDDDVKQRIISAATSEGRGRAAYGCWLVIQSEGWERARESFAIRTWYRHLNVLRAAGLGDADIAAGRVVQLRRRVMDAQLVTSWAQLARVA